MGWAFKNLTVHDSEHDEDDALTRAHRDRKRHEHTHTALDERVEIPLDFIPPTSAHTKPKASKRPKKAAVRSAAYSKRATGPAANRPTTTSASHSHRNASKRPNRSPSPPRDDPVDFVYDVAVRRALRERMDVERFETLRRAQAVNGSTNSSGRRPPPKKEAWPSTPPSAKTAIAPNVSEWRTQETPFHPSAATHRAERRRRESQERTRQAREAEDVAQSLAAFESQWSCA